MKMIAIHAAVAATAATVSVTVVHQIPGIAGLLPLRHGRVTLTVLPSQRPALVVRPDGITVALRGPLTEPCYRRQTVTASVSSQAEAEKIKSEVLTALREVRRLINQKGAF